MVPAVASRASLSQMSASGCGLRLRAPVEVQHECIPQAVLGMDIICQAKSGMGKTAVFVLSLHQLEPVDGGVISYCATRASSPSRSRAVRALSRPSLCEKVTSSTAASADKGPQGGHAPSSWAAPQGPHRLEGPNLSKLKHFVMDECDPLEALDMRRASRRSSGRRPPEAGHDVLSNFRQGNPARLQRAGSMEIYVDDDTKVAARSSSATSSSKRPRRASSTICWTDLIKLLFSSKVARATELVNIDGCNFPSVCLHSRHGPGGAHFRYKDFKDFKKRILVYGLFLVDDIERVNIVSTTASGGQGGQRSHRCFDQYCRVGRAGVSSRARHQLHLVQGGRRHPGPGRVGEVDVSELPDQIDVRGAWGRTRTLPRGTRRAGFSHAPLLVAPRRSSVLGSHRRRGFSASRRLSRRLARGARDGVAHFGQDPSDAWCAARGLGGRR